MRPNDAAPKAVTAARGRVTAAFRCPAAGAGAEAGPRGRKEMGPEVGRQPRTGTISGSKVFSAPHNQWSSVMGFVPSGWGVPRSRACNVGSSEKGGGR